MAFVEMKDVYKRYRTGEIVTAASDGINFTIEKGEFAIIVGPSGAGKTTVLNILGGMDTADEGQVLVDGSDIVKYTPRQLVTYRRHDIGFVFQFYNLVQNLTALENVELAAQICEDPIPAADALEAVGLDAYVGFLHRDRPGRNSMAQDLIEELRPCLADRFVLTLINNRMVSARDFEVQESGAVYLCDDARRTVLRRWQERKKEVILHPFLKEKIPWGLIPYVQALLLSRYIRGDLDAYPPFLWK